jgi:hypothetical protein
MSLGKQDIVPVDTHIHSIAITYYGQNKKSPLNTKNYNDISSFFEQLWKPFAGWAQAVSTISLLFVFFLVDYFFFFSQAAFSNELRGSKMRNQSNKFKRSKCKKRKILSIAEC